MKCPNCNNKIYHYHQRTYDNHTKRVYQCRDCGKIHFGVEVLVDNTKDTGEFINNDYYIINKEELNMAVETLTDYRIALFKKLSNQNQQWIPCSEKMPKDCGFYLVSCIDNDGWEHVKICSFHKQVVDEFSFFDAFSDTVAWQEIPKPYNKEELDVKYVVTNCEDCMHESICGVKEQFREALTECPAANGPFKIELRCEFFRKEQPTRRGGISYVKNNG